MKEPRYFVDLTWEDRHYEQAEREDVFFRIGKPSRRIEDLSLHSATILAESVCQHMRYGPGHSLFFIPASFIAVAIVAKVLIEKPVPSWVVIVDIRDGAEMDISSFFKRKEVMESKEEQKPLIIFRGVGTDEFITIRKNTEESN